MVRTAGFAVALALAVVACQDLPRAGTTPPAVPAAPVAGAAAAQLVGPVWQWQRTRAAGAPETLAEFPERYTLAFDADGRVRVRADCNRGSGSYRVDGTALKLGPVALTKMGCPPGSQDGAFLRALGQVATFDVVQGELVLSLADGATMRFQAAR